MVEKRKTFTITFNKGMDKMSYPFEANPERALDELNYVYRDGKVQKRLGLEQIFEFVNTAYVKANSTQVSVSLPHINGIWRFKAEDGQYHTVAHVGNLFYELKQEEGGWTADLFYVSRYRPMGSGRDYPRGYDFDDYKSTAVVGNKMLYFFGGNKLMKLRFLPDNTKSFVAVEDDGSNYVPTTTISITYRNSVVGGRASLDEVNLMTQWRKNRLLSGTGLSENGRKVNDLGYTYQLDAPIYAKSSADLGNIKVKITRRKV